MAWRPTSKQWIAFIPAAIFGVLSLMSGSYVVGILLFVVAGVLVWQLQPRGKPENMVVKSVTCAKCAAPVEPHWARCPKCGEAIRK